MALIISSEIPRPNYVLVDSPRKFEDLLRSVSNTERLSFDYETSAYTNERYLCIPERQRPLDLPRTTITSGSFRTSDGKCYYLSIDHCNSFNMPKESIVDIFKAKPHDAPMSAHNFGYEWSVSAIDLGIDLRDFGPFYDTMIAAYVLDTNQPVGLKDQTRLKLGILQDSYKAVTDGVLMRDLPASAVLRYGCDDSEYQWALEDVMHQQIRDLGLWTYYTELELPIVPIIAEMSLYGAYVDEEVLEQKTKYHLAEMAKLSRSIYDMLGYEFNLGSPVQLSRVMYDRLGLQKPPVAESETATDKESLYWNYWEHPVIPLILDWKKFSTRYKLYDKPYVNLIHPDTGVMHAQLRQTKTDTSRFAASSPNLQQLAKRGDGVEVRELYAPPRGLATAWGFRHPDYDHMLSCDMSQVELVLAAHRSKSPVLLEAYGPVRGDIHTRTTCALFDITPEQAKTNKLYRQAGKTANFSLLYGGQAMRIYRLIRLELAKMGMNCPFSLRDVENLIMKYFQLYPEIRTMQKEDVKFAKQHGYVKSIYGRRFYLPDIHSSKGYLRSKAERKATNSPIQGSCAELIKRAIINIYNERIPRSDAAMVMSIHDENVFYVTDKALRDVAHTVHKHMSDTPPGLRACMESEVSVGPNFGSMKTYAID